MAPLSDNQLQKRIIAIVAHNRGIQPAKLTLHTDLYQDLRLTGDDVDDLFDQLQNRMEIDFSEFQFSRHFTDEHLWPFPKSQTWKKQRIPVTIADLLRAAKMKKWTMSYESKE